MGKHHDKDLIVRRAHWGILKGEKGRRGDDGPRGKRGHNGRDGNDAVLSFCQATNDAQDLFTANVNQAVEFNNLYYPYLESNVSGNVVTLENEGIYLINYNIRGISSNTANPMKISLFNNGNLINGSSLSILSNSYQEISGSIITEVSSPNANIQLFNTGIDHITYNNIDNSTNASINVIRLV
jgi:hypothetical protein